MIVLPALGGETINDLCPFPIGLTKSISLAVLSGFFSIFAVSTSSFIRSLGYNGVKLSKAILFFPLSGSSKFILFTFNSAKYLRRPLPSNFPSTGHQFLNQTFYLTRTYINIIRSREII